MTKITPQSDMLKEMYDVIIDLQGCNNEEAFDILLSFVAVNVGLEQYLTTLPMKHEVNEKLHQLFNKELLKENEWDHFGQLLHRLGLKGVKEIKPFEEVQEGMKMYSVGQHEGMPQAILFEHAHTGRDIIYVHREVGSEAIYFGTETDLRLYRIALVNMRLYDIPAHILYADPTKVDTSIGSMNWRQANVWEPVNPDKLKQA